MSDAAMTWARRQRVGTSSRKLVLLVLADQADNYGFVSEHCTQAEIAAESELSERQVRRLLRELSPWFERVHRQGEGGGRQSDTFRLKMKETPVIVGAKPRQPDKLSAVATGQIAQATGQIVRKRDDDANALILHRATGQTGQPDIPPHTPLKISPSKRPPKGGPKGSPSFDELWTLWRAKDTIRRAKRKPAFETFERLVRGGADAERILAGARAYLGDPRKTEQGGAFMPDLFRWLRDEVWADWGEVAPSPADQVAERLRIWRERRVWNPAWGPEPDETQPLAAGAKP